MLSVRLILSAVVILCISGLQAYFFSSKSQLSQRISSLLMVLGAVCGVSGVVTAITSVTVASLTIPWTLPWGSFAIKIDSLSCVFLLPVFIVPALGSLYGLEYWNQKLHPENGQRLGAFYGILAGAMALVVIANDSVLFLISWEVMALAAFFAATVEDDNQQVRQAGWVYLVATHAGTLCLFAMFALWRFATGSFALNDAHFVNTGVTSAIFILAVVGFGFKAGIMPLHVWLPGAHANAPSHVSAVMSGVMLKMGIYGIIRMSALLPSVELWWGGLLIIIGVISGIAGIAFAIGQQDIKRMLAYSSIENIGIIMLGIGLALIGRYYHRVDIVFFGLAGSLLHVWNHSLFKSLLFMNAGAIIHAAHTRDIESMGGLGRRMPRTMALFIVGAIAIAALPPLNGFVSEWLIYLGFFHSLDAVNTENFSAIPIGAVALATIGPLAIVCFVKLLGTVFSGNERSAHVEHAHDPSAAMLLPMTILAAVCFFIGLFPVLSISVLEKAATVWYGDSVRGMALGVSESLQWISNIGGVLILTGGGTVFIFRKKLWQKNTRKMGTWDCGYASPTKKMQYSGSSISDTLVRLLRFMLLPKSHEPKVNGHFPRKSNFKAGVPDIVLDRLVLPVFHRAAFYLPMVRVFQRGQTHLYVLYILVIVLVLFVIGR